MIFGRVTKLTVLSQEKKEPEYYKFKLQNDTNGESCLVTRFTVQNTTSETWPVTEYPADAVRFEGEGYYSRFLRNVNENCNETESTCDGKTEASSSNFQSDAKTNFLALTIFWLRCFLKLVIQSHIGRPG
ncbi:hypothetical protein KOW79_006101 [Hemibagrus wyckioides]|uniref:Uncharacterized protein n=1 Tax=Hemibagrus wyckioides TaxID=337641 RepID=A0A9D3NX82_9TELE|nr:hypothetical protein KOW79_006101 [Hemibagrus wyckioides]